MSERKLKILIVGGGIAGPALAFWLQKKGHNITIVERFPALRASGAQVDLREQGIEVAKRMGLIDEIRSKLVKEPGTKWLDSNGNVIATFLANTSGKGRQTATSEYEIMRGDFVRILYDATKEKVKYLYGMTVERFEQDSEKVIAYFSDNTSDTFDLLVGADGQNSRIRKEMLPADAPSPYTRLGLNFCYYFVPRDSSDEDFSHFHLTDKGRLILRRSHNSTQSQVYLAFRDPQDKYSSNLKGATIEQQKQFWTETFQDVGWQTPRFLEGMKTAQDFYCQEIVKIRINNWSKGRVVLLGDAAYCASPLSGMGTSLALIGAYILAGELEKSGETVEQSILNYEQVMRPFVTEIQDGVKGGFARVLLPDSKLAIFGILTAIRTFQIVSDMISWTGISKFFSLFSKNEEEKDEDEENFGWKIPMYPNMNLKKNNHKTNLEIEQENKKSEAGNLRQRKGKKEEGKEEKELLMEEKNSNKQSNCTVV